MSKQLNRRDFLKISFTTGGALLIGAYLDACAPAEITPTRIPTAIATITSTSEPPEPIQPNMFVRIDPDGTVTLTIHRSEMGQGVRTALAMILAEELEADWSKVRVQQMDANKAVNQITSGSGSIWINYDPLRKAGAAVREILVTAAAQTWGISPEECKAENGIVTNTVTGEKLGYGELVGAAKDVKGPSAPSLKNPRDFKLIGASVPRIDDPQIVTGKAIYGLDVRVPEMLFAVLARSPVPGERLLDYDSTQAEAVPGVRAVVQVSRGVAVVAENTWAAIEGRNALDLTWSEGENTALSSKSIRAQLVETMNEAIAKEERPPLSLIEAVYETPYLAHAALEPVNCVAHVRSDRCEIWAPTQNPGAIQELVQERIGLPVDVHVTLLGGGFGRKLEVDYAFEAVDVSQAIDGPVQVVWTREDDIQHDFYRQVTYHWLRAGWDRDGNVQLWRHYLAGQGINGVAYQAGLEVLEEDLEAPYNLPDSKSQAFVVDFPVPTGPWRGVVSATNAFANECFLDELANALKKDPYEFRMELLEGDNQLRSVLQSAAERSDWESPLPEGHGRGIACHKTYGRTSVAMVAEVSVQDGAARVHKVTCAIDCGGVIHPDMIVQQMEGSIAFGLTSLKGEITLENGRVQQSNFHDYPLLQIDEMPEVDVEVLADDRPPNGLGEMGVPPIVPAVLNAIFNATGKRIRHTPIRPGDL